MKTKSGCASAALLVLLGGPGVSDSFGGTILQNEGSGSLQIAFFAPLGQSFVADDVQLSTIGFAFADMNPGHPNSPVTLSLYAGSGFGGTLLGSVTQTLPLTLPEIRAPFEFIDFNFSGHSLVPGATYTAVATTTSPKVGIVYNRRNAYAEGQLFEVNTVGDPGQDLVFRVVTVPEPAPAVLGPLSGLILLIRRRRPRAN